MKAATLRKSGFHMYDIPITMSIGDSDLIYVACIQKERNDKPMPLTRKEWLELLKKEYGCKNICEDDSFDYFEQETIKEAQNLCGMLFPELCIKVE